MRIHSLLLLMSLSFALPGMANPPGNTGYEYSIVPGSWNATGTRIEVKVQESADESSAELFLNNSLKTVQSPVIITTDEPDLAGSAIVGNPEKEVVLVPLATNNTESSARNWKSLLAAYPKRVLESARNDKIGFLIVTFTTLSDSYVWIHSAHLSNFERTGNVMFTVMTALFLGLDKDNWARATRPIHSLFKKVLGIGEGRLHKLDPRDLGVRFAASLTLATGLSMARLLILPPDYFVNSALQASGYSLSLLVSIISTLASFTWAENIAQVDIREYPLTKFVLRRAHEIRSIILGSFAATGMLLNPAQFGLRPWVVLSASGVVGMTLYSLSDEIRNFIESSQVLKRLVELFGVQSKFLPIQPLCRALFLGGISPRPGG